MKRRNFNQLMAGTSMAYVVNPWTNTNPMQELRIGVIGLDTSHSIAFTKIINTSGEDIFKGCKVTHAFPQGSLTIASSIERIPGYTEDIKQLGVTIVDSIGSLLSEVDVVLLETNDGGRHLEQAEEVFAAGKPVFIDKPISAELSDAINIFAAAKKAEVPMFSASSLRFSPSTQAVANGGSIGQILGADTYSPATLEPSHTDLYWYGIHGIESLCTVMGTGCQQVRRIFRDDMEVVVGEWADGRLGTFRGTRAGKHGYGGMAFGTEGTAPVGAYEGYEHLVYEIIRFFRSGQPPVSEAETLEIFALMTAADMSKTRNGAPVTLEEAIQQAKG